MIIIFWSPAIKLDFFFEDKAFDENGNLTNDKE